MSPYSAIMRERSDDRHMRQHDHDAQSQRNYLLIAITSPTDFANTDLPKIMANFCSEPVHAASSTKVHYA
jgi:hypothetical protein